MINRLYLLVLMLLITVSVYGQNRSALVIGNSTYRVSPLRNPVNDANLMSSTLRDLGFEVRTHTNLQTQNDMKRVVREFGLYAKSRGGVALVFYAGHAIQINGKNYLLPTQANIASEDYVDLECLDADEIFVALNLAGTTTNLVILDACRDNPFAGVFRSTANRGLASVSRAPGGTMIAFATAPGSVASDGNGSNGLYTEELVKVMKQTGISIENVFKEVRRNVMSRSNGAQQPWENSSLLEDFYFIGSIGGGTPVNPIITIEQRQLYGSLEVSVQTAGKLYIDGTLIGDVRNGTASVLRGNVPVGTRRVEIRYDGSNDREEKQVTVAEGGMIRVNFDFRRAQTSSAPETPQNGNMVLVQGGTFRNTRSNYYNKGVTVSDFWIGKYEVTQAEWEAVMGNNPSNFRGANLPVEKVSWYDCIEYCNRRSQREGLTPAYTIDKTRQDPNNTNSGDTVKWIVTVNWSANGYRLPTEAEWEYAAGGGQLSRSFTYSGSETLNDVAWFDGNSGNTTKPVGGKQANELGIFDMSGNVWEWCWDWYGGNVGTGANPRGPASGSFRVFRGGSWGHDDLGCESAYRSNDDPGDRSSSVGFRLLRTN